MQNSIKPVQKRSCPICRSTIHWGEKVGRCKCQGKHWPRAKLGGGPANGSNGSLK